MHAVNRPIGLHTRPAAHLPIRLPSALFMSRATHVRQHIIIPRASLQLRTLPAVADKCRTLKYPEKAALLRSADFNSLLRDLSRQCAEQVLDPEDLCMLMVAAAKISVGCPAPVFQDLRKLVLEAAKALAPNAAKASGRLLCESLWAAAKFNASASPFIPAAVAALIGPEGADPPPAETLLGEQSTAYVARATWALAKLATSNNSGPRGGDADAAWAFDADPSSSSSAQAASSAAARTALRFMAAVSADLQQVSRRSFMTVQDCSMILWAWATVDYTPPSASVSGIALVVERNPGSLSPQAMANIVWALSKLHCVPTSLLESIADQAPRFLPISPSDTRPSTSGRAVLAAAKAPAHFKPQEISNLMGGFASLGFNPVTLWAPVEAFVALHIETYNLQDLAEILLSYAMQGQAPVSKPFFDRMLLRAEALLSPPTDAAPSQARPYPHASKTRFVTLTQVGKLLWSLARMHLSGSLALAALPTRLIDRLVTELRDRLPEFLDSPRALTRSLWALVALHRCDSALLDAIADTVGRNPEKGHLQGFDSQSISLLLWCFARQGYSYGPSGRALLREMAFELDARGFESLEPKNVAQNLWAFSKLGFFPGEDILQDTAEHLAARGKSYNLQSLLLLLWSFASLGYCPDDDKLLAVLRQLQRLRKGIEPRYLGVLVLNLARVLRIRGSVAVEADVDDDLGIRRAPAVEDALLGIDPAAAPGVAGRKAQALEGTAEGAEEDYPQEGAEPEAEPEISGGGAFAPSGYEIKPYTMKEAAAAAAAVPETEIVVPLDFTELRPVLPALGFKFPSRASPELPRSEARPEVNEFEPESTDPPPPMTPAEEAAAPEGWVPHARALHAAPRGGPRALDRLALGATSADDAAAAAGDDEDEADDRLDPAITAEVERTCEELIQYALQQAAKRAPSFTTQSLANLIYGFVRLRRGYFTAPLRPLPPGISAVEPDLYKALAVEIRRRADTFTYEELCKVSWALARALPDSGRVAASALAAIAPLTLTPEGLARADFSPTLFAQILRASATVGHDPGPGILVAMIAKVRSRSAEMRAYDLLQIWWALVHLGLIKDRGESVSEELLALLLRKVPLVVQRNASPTSPTVSPSPTTEEGAPDLDLSLSSRDAVLFAWSFAVLGLTDHPVFKSLALTVEALPKSSFGGETLFQEKLVDFKVATLESLDSLRRLTELEALFEAQERTRRAIRKRKAPAGPGVRPASPAVAAAAAAAEDNALRVPIVLRQRAELALVSETFTRAYQESEKTCQELIAVLADLPGTDSPTTKKLLSGGVIAVCNAGGRTHAFLPLSENLVAANSGRPVGSALARKALLLVRRMMVHWVPLDLWAAMDASARRKWVAGRYAVEPGKVGVTPQQSQQTGSGAAAGRPASREDLDSDSDSEASEASEYLGLDDRDQGGDLESEEGHY